MQEPKPRRESSPGVVMQGCMPAMCPGALRDTLDGPVPPRCPADGIKNRAVSFMPPVFG